MDIFGPETVITILVGIAVHWIFSDDNWKPPFRKDPP